MSLETRFIVVDGSKVRVYESIPKFEDSAKPVIVFLHGFSFSIDDWESIGTLKKVGEQGFRVVAIDLPSGKVSKSDRIELKEISEYNPILARVLSQLNIPQNKKLVMIGPSMGGGFALSFALESPERMAGLVLIAPSLHRISEKSIKSLKSNIPVLLVWGENDDVFPVDEYAKPLQNLLSRTRLVVLKGAGHPAYLDKPEEFHKHLFDFLDEAATGFA